MKLSLQEVGENEIHISVLDKTVKSIELNYMMFDVWRNRSDLQRTYFTGYKVERKFLLSVGVLDTE